MKRTFLTFLVIVLTAAWFAGISSAGVRQQGSTSIPLEPITAANADRIEQLATLEGEWITQIAWSPNGKTLAVASPAGLWLHEIDNLDAAPRLLGENTDWVENVAWSPDGTMLASGGTDSTIWLWGVPVGGLPHDALSQPEGLPEFSITVDTVQAPTECTPSGWTSTYNRTTTISDLDASTLTRYFAQYVDDDLNFVHYWGSGYSAYVQDYWISAGTESGARAVGDYTIPLQNDTYHAESIEYILQADAVIWEIRTVLTCENSEVVAYEITSEPVQSTRDTLPEFTQNLVLALDDIPLYGNPYAQTDYFGTIKAGQTFFITSIYRPRASISVWAHESVTRHDIMIFDGTRGLPIVDVAEDYEQSDG